MGRSKRRRKRRRKRMRDYTRPISRESKGLSNTGKTVIIVFESELSDAMFSSFNDVCIISRHR